MGTARWLEIQAAAKREEARGVASIGAGGSQLLQVLREEEKFFWYLLYQSILLIGLVQLFSILNTTSLFFRELDFCFCVKSTGARQHKINRRNLLLSVNVRILSVLQHPVMFSLFYCLIPNQHFLRTVYYHAWSISLWTVCLLTAHPLLLRGLILF